MQRTFDLDPKVRRSGLLDLCPCHIRADVPSIWDRIFEMLSDDDPGVRSIILHCLTDGSPRSRQDEVVAALEFYTRDEDRKLRRRARRALSIYHRTGRIVET